VTETRAMLSLAWPVILAEIGWVTMGLVDVIAVGPLGPAAIGAVSSGSTIFFAFMVFGIGTFYALDTFVSQSYGAGRVDECHRWLFAGLHLAWALSVLLMGLGWCVAALLPWAGIHPDILPLLQEYLRALLWSVPALLIFSVMRRYLQAMNVVRIVMVAVVAANIINAVANWVLIYGHLGVPALGAVGAAYATLAARTCMLGVLAATILVREHARPAGLHDVPFAPDVARMWRIVRLGLPAACQIVLEVGVFAAASALAARISPVALAANQIVLTIASFFFMVPLGLSSAAAVRVGQAIGRADPQGARRAGWSAIRLTGAAAAAIALALVLFRGPLLALFTAEASVVSLGVTVLILWALVQPFDGVQAVATGALRGAGETRIPMWVNLGGHWGVGLPLAYALCFTRGWGVIGLWTGLAISLTLVGGILLAAWHHRSQHLHLREQA
jgi:MATE family multidrug resistance protein